MKLFNLINLEIGEDVKQAFNSEFDQ